jgi:hypothetical protein
MDTWRNLWATHFGSGNLARAILAIMFSAAYIYMSIMGIDPGEAFIAVVTAVVLWFFKSQDDERAHQRMAAREDEIVELAKRLPPG